MGNVAILAYSQMLLGLLFSRLRGRVVSFLNTEGFNGTGVSTSGLIFYPQNGGNIFFLNIGD